MTLPASEWMALAISTWRTAATTGCRGIRPIPDARAASEGRFVRGPTAKKERVMVLEPQSIRALVLRLIVGLALLGCARVSSAEGTWSVIAPAGNALGQVNWPWAVTVDASGNLYVAEAYGSYRLM